MTTHTSTNKTPTTLPWKECVTFSDGDPGYEVKFDESFHFWMIQDGDSWKVYPMSHGDIKIKPLLSANSFEEADMMVRVYIADQIKVKIAELANLHNFLQSFPDWTKITHPIPDLPTEKITHLRY